MYFIVACLLLVNVVFMFDVFCEKIEEATEMWFLSWG